MSSPERDPVSTVWGGAPGQRGGESEIHLAFRLPKKGDSLDPFEGFLGNFQSDPME